VLHVVNGRVQGVSPLHFSNAEYALAKQQIAGVSNNNASIAPVAVGTEGAVGDASPFNIISLNDASGSTTLPVVLLSAFIGGLILNLMPCVLPVIGLKILGFAEQAGHSRSKILVLNLWYAAGMLAVFLALATLAAGAKLGISEQGLGWGEQNSNAVFNVVMAGLVFVMALSFLGVWEIPIPGFVGSGKSQELASREGASGAFSKGIVTTLLATPCSGPFLGPVIGFTLTQPPATIYMIFVAIGLGMASPYLLIGAFPSLIGWIPKPGAWMETFKHIMGFVLLGTVAFIFSYMNKDYIVPTFVLLIGLWAACWWIGRTPTYEPVGKQLAAWAQGGVFAALIGWFAFSQLLPRDEILPWQPFDRVQLAELNRQGKTVLVDFSADWCLTCKYNLKTAINTQAVANAIERNRVVTMLADWTDGSPEVTQMLNDLKSNSIPVLAIFPADSPNKVLVLRDLVTKRQVLDAIAKAGPSRSDPSVAMTSD
jgi:thiol:disulfide interchange protein